MSLSSFTLPPPGKTERVHARSVLVVAPHYDDEVLGCGGLLCELVASGAVARVLFLTDGQGDVSSEAREAYGARRRREARQATAALGLSGFDELGLPDGALDQHLDDVVAGLRRALLSQRPDLLLVTSPLESSADHRAAFAAAHRLLGGARPGGELSAVTEGLAVLAYEVNQPLYPNLLVDVSAHVGAIERAMGCYASQQERHDYLAAGLGLRRFRSLTLASDIKAVEAFRRLVPMDFVTRGPARLIEALGGAPPLLRVEEGPRVSVIVRTKDRPELLVEALGSLAASTYRRAEVVVVNDGGEAPPIPPDHPLDLRRVDLDGNRGRAAAAEAGVAASSGDYLTFLDDDDLAEPEHLATLASMVSAAGVRVAYTDAAVGVYELGPSGGWSCVERRLPYSRDFDVELLRFDNYIPFNTLMIERRLCAEIGPFDAALPFFEDWDFLIRLAERVPFHHLSRVTCEYRHFRGAGHHVLGDQPRHHEDFLAVKARVLAKHGAGGSPMVTVRVVDRLRAEAVREAEEARRLAGDLAAGSRELQELAGKASSFELHNEGLRNEVDEVKAELRRFDLELRKRDDEIHAREREIGQRDDVIRDKNAEIERLGANIREQGEHLAKTFAEIERLGDLLDEMRSTRAWRLHEWWQRRKP